MSEQVKEEMLRELQRLREVKDMTTTQGWKNFMETIDAFRTNMVKELCNIQHNNDTLRTIQGRIDQLDNIKYYGENVDNFISSIEDELHNLEHPEDEDD